MNAAGLLHQVVYEAVRSRQLLRLNYHQYSRVVEPHAFGRDEAGKPVLVAWQRNGGCESGVKVGWKQFLLEEITGFVELPEYFEAGRQPGGACNLAIAALKADSPRCKALA
ncbi:hypothetical protein [Nevskia soli]|uniref:hypothetical protein n=1 Tax=Nevskia soli TaxID=418856 RepID=UPI00068BF441|nr:hypothetical protein [Nevskia soli]